MDCLETNKQENCKRSASKMTSFTKKRCEFKFKKEKRPKLNIRDHLNVNDKIESLCNKVNGPDPQLEYQSLSTPQNGFKIQNNVRFFVIHIQCMFICHEGLILYQKFPKHFW